MSTIIKTISENITSCFGDSVEFALVFGSFARGENVEKSDVDIMIVFKDFIKDLNKISAFKKNFVELQVNAGLTPDDEFPGEYITTWELKKALTGYGFAVEDETVIINPIGPKEWNHFNEYRQWLCAMAGPNVLMCGNEGVYEKFKQSALSVVCLVAMSHMKNDTFNRDQLIEGLVAGGKEYFGFVDSVNTKKYLHENVSQVLKTMVTDGYLETTNNGYRFIREKMKAALSGLKDKNDLDFKKNFIGPFSSSEETSLLKQCLSFGLDNMTESTSTIDYLSEVVIKNKFLDSVPENGENLSAVIKEFKDKIQPGSIKQFNPGYLAFPDSGNSLAGLCAELLIAFTNQNLIATTKSAPSATFAEIQVLIWLRELIGFPTNEKFPDSALDVGGEIVSGGTMANAVAVLTARCNVFPESRTKGMSSVKVRPILIVAGPTMYHYSHIASFWWLGLGEENIVYIKTLPNYKFDLEDLDNKLGQYNDGVTSKVVAVICHAGDSRTTAIENLPDVLKITKQHKVWLHVDACHGGSLIFSETHKSKLRGIEQVDSISMDPHKGLCLTYPSSVVLFRDVDNFKQLGKYTDITIQKGSYDLGQVTPFVGSKSFDSLKLWFLIKNLGVRGIGRLIDYRYDLAKKWSEMIQKSKYFFSLNDVELNSVVFSVSPEKIKLHHQNISECQVKDISSLNKVIHDGVYKEGYICIHSFDLQDLQAKFNSLNEKVRVLGVIFGNPNTVDDDFPAYTAYLDKIAQKAIEEKLST